MSDVDYSLSKEKIEKKKIVNFKEINFIIDFLFNFERE